MRLHLGRERGRVRIVSNRQTLQLDLCSTYPILKTQGIRKSNFNVPGETHHPYSSSDLIRNRSFYSRIFAIEEPEINPTMVR